MTDRILSKKELQMIRILEGIIKDIKDVTLDDSYGCNWDEYAWRYDEEKGTLEVKIKELVKE